jgi:hypothetical protein
MIAVPTTRSCARRSISLDLKREDTVVGGGTSRSDGLIEIIAPAYGRLGRDPMNCSKRPILSMAG